MSDETTTTQENSPSPDAKAAPRVRRISTPRPKKVAKPSEPAAVKEEAVALVAIEPPQVSAQAPTSVPSHEPRQAANETDWPEPEAASSGSLNQSDGAKRKRRRRKGKGQGTPQATGPLATENSSSPIQDLNEPLEAPHDAPRPAASQPAMKPSVPAPPAMPRPRIDPELLAKMAWKIYLAEVSEEGVALIGDNDAKDLSRRCFRLAEIFIEEQSRRR